MEKKTSKKKPKQIPETQAECACFFRDLAFLVKKEAHPGQGLCLHAPYTFIHCSLFKKFLLLNFLN